MREDIFEKNLEAMDKWYPEFTKIIRDKAYKEDEIDIYIEYSLDGEKIFRVEKDGRSLYLEGKRNAIKPVEMWQERLGKIHKYAPIFLFGLGNGNYLKSMIKNSPKEANIVVYEPSLTIFLTTLKEIDLSEVIKNRPIAFIVEGLNEDEFSPVMKKVLILETYEYFKEEIHPNYNLLFAEKLLEKAKILSKETETEFVNFGTGDLFKENLAQNVLYNMPYIAEGYNTGMLADVIPSDKVGIVVSAGPSLNKNIHELKRAKNHLFIVAVDTAVKPLIKAGIMPDIFVTIDAKKPLDLLQIEGAEELAVVAPTAARYGILEPQKGKKLFFLDGYALPLNLYLFNQKTLPSVAVGGSVACSAFSLLYKLGFETVILVGQDLAYTDNKSHVDGAFKDKMEEEDTSHMIKVKGNYQDKVPTEPNLKIYLEWFVDYIKGAKERGKFRVINATEGGAYIEGTELMTLKEALDECMSEEYIDYSEKINSMKTVFSEEDKEKNKEFLKDIPKHFTEIQVLADKLIKEYKTLVKLSKNKNTTQKSYQKSLKRIKKATSKCESYAEYQLITITLNKADYILRTEYYYEEDDSKTDNEINEIYESAKRGIKYNEIMKDCAKLLEEVSEQMLVRAGLKTAEEAGLEE